MMLGEYFSEDITVGNLWLELLEKEKYEGSKEIKREDGMLDISAKIVKLEEMLKIIVDSYHPVEDTDRKVLIHAYLEHISVLERQYRNLIVDDDTVDSYDLDILIFQKLREIGAVEVLLPDKTMTPVLILPPQTLCSLAGVDLIYNAVGMVTDVVMDGEYQGYMTAYTAYTLIHSLWYYDMETMKIHTPNIGGDTVIARKIKSKIEGICVKCKKKIEEM